MEPELNIWKKQTSVEHLHYFLDKIKRNEPFSLIRPADGEYMILKGDSFNTQDEWSYVKNSLTNDLHESLTNAANNKNIYIGIPCIECLNNIEINKYYLNNYNIDDRMKTYANVFCNRNFRIFASFLISNQISFYYIGPGTFQNTEYKLNVIDRFTNIDLRLVNNWDNLKNNYLSEIIQWVGKKLENNNKIRLFLISSGPCTKIIIPKLIEKYPNCQFVDVGSTLDIFMKGQSNRHYLHPNQSGYNMICDHNHGHKDIPEITCILNVFKRPHCLLEQLKAIRRQTIKPKQILIWVNHVEGIEIPEEVKNDKELIIVNSSYNFGVWGRFSLGLLANTKYVCVFDDDTIPGSKWLENCYETMKQVNGLLGTIGVIFKPNTDNYEIEFRVGWDRPNDEILRADIVGHSWFFKKEWLQYLWTLQPILDLDEQLICGEDIGFSCALQKVGISTYVPPHPKNDLEMFGSYPEKAWKYGTENVAISMNPASSSKFSRAYKYYKKEHGFQILLENQK